MNTSPVVYLDHAATTPLLPEAIDAMTEELGRLGNPSSLHAAGRRARRVVEESREQIAEVFGARASEVIFTSGGTEADNLAVKGLFWARRAADERRCRVLTTAVEHHAVLDSVRWLATASGACADWVGVDRSGLVRPSELREALERDPGSAAVVSVMWANNEVGTVQPIAALAEVAHEFGVPFHTDAVQAAAQLPVDFAASGVDAMTVTGHKLGGPVGAGGNGGRSKCSKSPKSSLYDIADIGFEPAGRNGESSRTSVRGRGAGGAAWGGAAGLIAAGSGGLGRSSKIRNAAWWRRQAADS